jgi:hypothetical protein
MLKKAGFIAYVRGKVTVLDRAGLESTSCACYQAIVAAYDSLLPAHPERSAHVSDTQSGQAAYLSANSP